MLQNIIREDKGGEERTFHHTDVGKAVTDVAVSWLKLGFKNYTCKEFENDVLHISDGAKKCQMVVFKYCRDWNKLKKPRIDKG